MILNPRTNRMIKIGSQMYKKALKDGSITIDNEINEINEPTPPPIKRIKDIKIDNDTDDEPELNNKMSNLCTDLIKDNKTNFKKLSQKESDELLKKLLLKKLSNDKPIKKKKKPKKVYSSSESSESE